MKKYYLIIFLNLVFFPIILKAANINVINVEQIINNSIQYKSIIQNIEASQNEYLLKFKLEEENLDTLQNEIENSKLILTQEEINIKIDNYNNTLNNFTNLVDNFNQHYQNEVMLIRKKILEQIIVLLEKYAKNNKVDLILDSNSYLIASNSINITLIIEEQLSKININLDFKNFEEN